MPVRNSETYIRQAVDSILIQTCPDFEFLIYDDGSTDKTADILRKCAQHDSRLHITYGTNQGYAAWLVKGVEQATGQFLARMDSDDISRPDRFQTQLDYMMQHPQCVAVGGQVQWIDADGWPIGPHHLPCDHISIDSGQLDARGAMITHPAVMMRTHAVRAVGSYQPNFETAEDMDLFLRLAEVGALANLPSVVLNYRVHMKSVSRIRRVRQREASLEIANLARARRGLPRLQKAPWPITDSSEWSEQQQWARLAFHSGNYATARKYAWRTFCKSFWRASSWKLLVGAVLGNKARPLLQFLNRPG